MPDDEPDHEPAPHRAASWVVRSWLGPAAVTVVLLAAAIGNVHKHRDAGGLLGAAACALLAVHVWRVWRRARRIRPSQHPGE